MTINNCCGLDLPHNWIFAFDLKHHKNTEVVSFDGAFVFCFRVWKTSQQKQDARGL